LSAYYWIARFFIEQNYLKIYGVANDIIGGGDMKMKKVNPFDECPIYIKRSNLK